MILYSLILYIKKVYKWRKTCKKAKSIAVQVAERYCCHKDGRKGYWSAYNEAKRILPNLCCALWKEIVRISRDRDDYRVIAGFICK